MIRIAYIIGTHNEGKSIKVLVDSLLKDIENDDEIIIVDNNSTDPLTLDILDEYRLTLQVHNYDKPLIDFSHYKNYKKSLTTAHYIFDLDGDEMINPTLVKTLREIIINNHLVDVFTVPRVNIVEGITPEYVKEMQWNLSEEGYINFPDRQRRIYRNAPTINWTHAVHETLKGYSTEAHLPHVDREGNKVTDYSILHIKTFERQKSQNEFYSKF
jgi:glycosyltransferase involved in cell wall biosynthesis